MVRHGLFRFNIIKNINDKPTKAYCVYRGFLSVEIYFLLEFH